MTDFLFATPTWVDGVMSLLDLFDVSTEYNISKTPEEADRRAFKADVATLNKDMQNSINSVIGLNVK